MRSVPHRRALRTRLAVGAVAIVMLLGIVSILRRQIDEIRHPFASDSVYQRNLVAQEQLSRGVRTDSLIHLWVRLADASSAEAGPIAKEISCEMVRLVTRYGSVPSEKAQLRAEDSLRKAQPELAARAHANFNNLPPGAAAFSIPACHLERLPIASDSMNVKAESAGTAKQSNRP
jgi:hypothetical protein